MGVLVGVNWMGVLSNKHVALYKGALYLSLKLYASQTTILIWLNTSFSVQGQLICKLSPLVFILSISYEGNPVKEIQS